MTATIAPCRLCAGRKPGHRLRLCAVLLARDVRRASGPALVPYDPLASDTAQALTGPSAAHWFGTDQLGRDIFSPRRRRDPARSRHRGGLGGAGLRHRHARRARRRLFRRLDRPHRRPRGRHDHGVSAVRAGDGHRRRARQQRRQHRLSRPRSSICRSMHGSPAPRPMSGAMPALSRRRGCAATARGGSCSAQFCRTSCR